MAKTRGTVLVALKDFVREQFGDDGWERLLDTLDDADRLQVELPTSISWYDIELVFRALGALDEVLGAGDLGVVERFGRFEAERDLTTIQRVFLRMASPAWVVEKVGQYWRRFADFGEWDIQREAVDGNKAFGVTAVLMGVPRPDRCYCAELTGYFARCLELVGAKDVSVTHPECRAKGDPRCAFVGRWRA